MSETNGATRTIPEQTTGDGDYRPRPPSTSAVYEEVIGSLSHIVTHSTMTAERFVRHAESRPSYGYAPNGGEEIDTATQLGYLVDATECLEIALTHIGQLKAAISHRLRVEDETNVGIGYMPF